MTKAPFLLPTMATKPADIETSWRLLQPLRDAGHPTGLMLVQRRYERFLEERETQYENLRPYAKAYGKAPVVVMLANLPIEGIDFLHHPQEAARYVEAGIEFAENLPIGGRRIVTFHLNSLVSPEEFRARSRHEWWRVFFEGIEPILDRLSRVAADHGVQLAIESVPTPEFGDRPLESEETYRGGKLRDMLNPFYMFGNFSPLVAAGNGICLDLCHGLQIYKQAAAGDPCNVLHREDVQGLQRMQRHGVSVGLRDDVEMLDPDTDLIHFNDGAGLYTPQGGQFQEGLVPGTGDIKDLGDIFAIALDARIPMVIEIDETDFIVRPKTREAIDWVLKHLG